MNSIKRGGNKIKYLSFLLLVGAQQKDIRIH